MRIFTLLAISIFISSSLSAQQKGNILINGAIGFSKSKNDEPTYHYKQTNFSFRPSVGKFYKTNRMVGVNLNYHRSNSGDSLINKLYGAGFFLRQYQVLGKSFFLFAEEGINGYSSRYNYPFFYPGPGITKEKSINLNVYPGLAYAVNKRLQLELGLPQLITIGYMKRTIKNESNQPMTITKYSVFSVDTGFNEYTLSNLGFGISWMIAKI